LHIPIFKFFDSRRDDRRGSTHNKIGAHWKFQLFVT
jgi:hypothetical protein